MSRRKKDRLNEIAARMVRALKGMGDYNPAFDDPLIESIARSMVYIERAEALMDESSDIDVISFATDIVVKRTAAIRQAIEDLAANRKEKLRRKAGVEVRDEMEKFVEADHG